MIVKIQINQSGVYEYSAVNAAVDLMGKAIKRSESIQISVASKYIYVFVAFIRVQNRSHKLAAYNKSIRRN